MLPAVEVVCVNHHAHLTTIYSLNKYAHIAYFTFLGILKINLSLIITDLCADNETETQKIQ